MYGELEADTYAPNRVYTSENGVADSGPQQHNGGPPPYWSDSAI